MVSIDSSAARRLRQRLSAASLKKYANARMSGDLHDAAVVQRDRTAADAPDQLAVVGGDEHGRAPRVDLAEQVHDLERQIGIEVAGRLVGEDDDGIVHERARDRDALLLAARELERKRVHPVLQPHPLEHLERAALLLRDRKSTRLNSSHLGSSY